MKHVSLSLVIAILSLLVSTRSSAQNKIGYINMDELIAAMPETKQAQQALQAYADSLSKVDSNMQQDFTTKRDAFFRDSASMDNTKKEAQRSVLQKLIQQYQQFRSEAQQQMDSTQQALSATIESKAEDAVTATAKANGYAYVFRKVVGTDNQQRAFVIVGPQGDDLLPLVKKRLGLSAQ